MNKKLFLEIVFLSVGSFILIFLGTVVTINFFKDSRIFAKPSTAIVTEPSPKKTSGNTNSTAKPNASTGTNKQTGTFVYVKPSLSPTPSQSPKTSTSPSPSGTAKSSASPTNSSGNTPGNTPTNRIQIELINYTGFNNIRNQMKMTLEMGGFDVYLVNTAGQSATTQIIERSSKNAGPEVGKYY